MDRAGRKAERRTAACLALALAATPALPRADGEVRGIGGYRAFAQPADRAVLPGGPAYGVAVVLGFAPWAALEGAYVGSTFGAQGDLGPQRVMQNDAWAALRLGPRYGPVRPYAFGGGGWTWLRNESGPGLYVRDQGYAIAPVGGGIDVALGRSALLGVRGAYELGFRSNAVSSATPSDRTDQLLVTAELAARF